MTTPPYDDEPRNMAWPRDEDDEEHDEPSIENEDDSASLSTREAELEVQKALEDRPPHVSRPKPKDETPNALDEERQVRRALQRQADPILALMVIGAVSIGLTPVDAVIRYVLLWTMLGGAGLLAYTLGASQRITQTTLDDLMAGIGFGLGIGIPLLIALGSPLASISERMFEAGEDVPAKVMDTWVFMAVIFVQPAADSLFFRGAMQQFRNFALTAMLATLWTIALFFPHMQLGDATGVAAMLAIFFTFLNFLYSYVRVRNGLAAAWVCQIIGGGLLWFFPRLLF